MLGRLLRDATRHDERDEQRDGQTYTLGQMAGLIKASMGASGPPVSIDKALTHAATSACVDVLASSAAMMPMEVVRYQGKVPVELPTQPSLIAAPSTLVDQDVWVYQLVDSMFTDGNGFGVITAVDGMARPTSIELLDPCKVKNRNVVNGVPQVSVDGNTMKRYPHGDLFLLPGPLTRAGSPFGDSPVQRASDSIGAALAARMFGRQFFEAGGHPTWLIYSDEELNEDQAQAVKDAWKKATEGREPGVFGSGLKGVQVSVNPDDSQFLELMRFCIEEACRFFRVPPSMVYAATSGQNVTYANASQADLNYLKFSLDRVLVRIERALSNLLSRPQVVMFDRESLLRLDAETRWKIHDTRLRQKSTSVNEVRIGEGEQPFTDPDFDKPGIPGVAMSEPPISVKP